MLAMAADPGTRPTSIDFALCFAGVQGFPNHAFIRVFRPDQYDEWYAGLPD